MGSTLDYIVFSPDFLIYVESKVPTRTIVTIIYLLIDIYGCLIKFLIILPILMIFHYFFYMLHVLLVTVRTKY